MFRRLLSRLPVDTFLLLLMATVALAAVLPVRGQGAVWTEHAASAAVAILFFLYGTRLAPRNLLEGLLHWRLQGLVFAATYGVFPLLGLILVWLAGGWLPPALALGLMFVCVLPSTVQSSIAFTSIAGGNVPAALCAATLSNLAGIVMTPALVALLLSARSGGFNLDALWSIALNLLLPFVVGQVMRPWIGSWMGRHKALTGLVDRGSILLVVYSAFSEGVVAGIWQQLAPSSLAILVLLDSVLLALAMLGSWVAARMIGLKRADEVVAVFCGSKKSLATGIPMANILFAGQAVGLVVLPLMLFHQIQLFVCAALARRYAQATARAVNQTPPVARELQPAA
ncbi:bile acid:sodium symporter family protein [Teichococcus vastitatis]|uniref:Bile acid:sodium symporter n=1 Tax=Teichococcus vastitatis TaxID=2307076 RepID=A0ABS9W2E7_9PROT|nr:bile acid:sodium symporter family protein [Pseudoroseomonas vastitatis]MCI0753233.1 bile acid:sodium symporter [Pseudoroseomonas vastitatis]